MDDATQTAREFLDLLEERRLDEVAERITQDFFMVWPGGVRLTLDDLKKFTSGRFKEIKNVYETVDAVPTTDGTAVYFVGSLEGIFSDESPFSDIRFVDRVFVNPAGQISDLLVWSDLGEELRKRGL